MNFPFFFSKKAFVILTALLYLCACTKPKNDAQLYIISGPAHTTQQNTNAIGSISGIYNPAERKIAYNIVWSSLSSSAVSCCFYIEDRNHQDSLIYQLNVAEQVESGVNAGHMIINPAQIEQLMGQNWRFAVCTTRFKEGEIKGKVTVSRN